MPCMHSPQSSRRKSHKRRKAKTRRKARLQTRSSTPLPRAISLPSASQQHLSHVWFIGMLVCLLCALFVQAKPLRGEPQKPLFTDLLEFSGYLQTTYRQGVYEKTPLNATQRVYLETRINQESWIRGFASGYVDAEFAQFGRYDSDEPFVTPEVGEAYLTIDTRYLDIIIGMQQIRWGEADALSTFDIINPIDFRNPISTARSSQRLAVGAVDLRFNLAGKGLFDFVFIPIPRFSRLPESGSPWEDLSLETLRDYTKAGIVRMQYDNGPFEPEFAARLKFFRPGYDFAFLFYRGYEHKPLYQAKSIDYSRMQAILEETYKPYTAFGINTAISFWESTLRTELTVKLDYPFQSDEIQIERRNDFCAIIGWDRNFLTNLNVNLQAFYFSHDGEEVIGKDRNRYGATWSISNKFFDDALTAGVRGEIFANNGDYCIEVFADYEYNDNLSFQAGYMLFGGEEENDLGQYNKNDHFYLGIKYSF